MKGIKYKIEVSSDFGITHGWSSAINEVYVPEYNLYINGSATFIEDNEHDNPRWKTGTGHEDIDIPEKLAKSALVLINADEVFKKNQKKFFEGLKNND